MRVLEIVIIVLIILLQCLSFQISESFHFDLNSSEMNKMLAVQMTSDFLPSVSRSAIFSIAHPNQDVYLVVKLEKVLQQGDISDCADPYMKDMDVKVRFISTMRYYVI